MKKTPFINYEGSTVQGYRVTDNFIILDNGKKGHYKLFHIKSKGWITHGQGIKALTTLAEKLEPIIDWDFSDYNGLSKFPSEKRKAILDASRAYSRGEFNPTPKPRPKKDVTLEVVNCRIGAHAHALVGCLPVSKHFCLSGIDGNDYEKGKKWMLIHKKSGIDVVKGCKVNSYKKIVDELELIQAWDWILIQEWNALDASILQSVYRVIQKYHGRL